MTNDALIHLLELLKTDLINSMQADGRYATGQTAKQITVIDNGSNVQLQVPGYLPVLESGRGPTSSNAAAGNPPMIQRLAQWCEAKGIPAKAIWAIKKSIDKKGLKGTPGILTVPLGDDNVNLRLKPVLESIADIAALELFSKLK